MKPEKIPNTWEYIEGILVYKNTVCPVLNLHMKFGIKDVGIPAFCQIIIINTSYGIIGILSDAVYEIKEYNDVTLFDQKRMPRENIFCFIAGCLKFKEKYIAILDSDKLLEDPRIISFNELSAKKKCQRVSSVDELIKKLHNECKLA